MTRQEAINKIRMYIRDIADYDVVMDMYNWYASQNTSYNVARYQWIIDMDELEHELSMLTVPELIELGKDSSEFYAVDPYVGLDEDGNLVSFNDESLDHYIDDISQDMAEYAVDFERDLNNEVVYEILTKYLDSKE